LAGASNVSQVVQQGGGDGFRIGTVALGPGRSLQGMLVAVDLEATVKSF